MVADLELLRTADERAARRFFAEVDPGELAASVGRADAATLAATLARHEVGAAAFTGILARLGEYAAAGHLVSLERILAVADDLARVETVELVGALAAARAEDLRRLMTTGFRPLVLAETFRRLPDFLDSRRAAGVDLTVGLRLTGSPSGEVERYVVRVADACALVSAGEEGSARDATVTCEGHDFLRLVTGRLSPVVGVLRGQLSVRGDRARALRLISVFDIPQAP